MLFLISIIFCFISLVASKKLFNDPLSPLSAYVIAWSLCLGLYSLNFVSFSEVSYDTFVLIFSSILCFVCGFVLTSAPLFLGNRHGVQISWPYPLENLDYERVRRPLLIMFVIGMCGFSAYLYVLNDYVGLTRVLLSLQFDEVRATQSLSEFNDRFSVYRSLNYVNIATVPFGVFYIIRKFRATGRVDKFILLLVALAFTATLFSADRTQPFTCILWTFFSYYYLNVRVKSVRRIIFTGAALVTVLLTVFISVGLLTGKSFENAGYLHPYLLMDDVWGPLAIPYVYITGNIPAFDKYIEYNSGDYSYGTFMLSQPIKLINAITGSKFQYPPELGDFYRIPFDFNTYTYLNVFYKDFGPIGVLVFPFLLGLWIGFIYYRHKTSPNIFNSFFVSFCGYCLLQSVFTNKFMSSLFWEFIFIVFILHVTISKKRREDQNALVGGAKDDTALV